MEADTEKVDSILGVIQLKKSLKDEDLIQEEQLREAVGEDVSNELYYLHESEVIELTEKQNQTYIGFTADVSEELGDTKPLNLDLEALEETEIEDEPDSIDDEDLLDKGIEIESPERYVAALKPFGDAMDQNPEIALSEDHINSYVGEDLGFELRTLTEWDYLTELEPEELGISNIDSNFYRLNTGDQEVHADATFSSMHIDKYYGGSVEKFLRQHSEQDSESLKKQGVNFYKAVG